MIGAAGLDVVPSDMQFPQFLQSPDNVSGPNPSFGIACPILPGSLEAQSYSARGKGYGFRSLFWGQVPPGVTRVITLFPFACCKFLRTGLPQKASTPDFVTTQAHSPPGYLNALKRPEYVTTPD